MMITYIGRKTTLPLSNQTKTIRILIHHKLSHIQSVVVFKSNNMQTDLILFNSKEYPNRLKPNKRSTLNLWTRLKEVFYEYADKTKISGILYLRKNQTTGITRLVNDMYIL